MNARAGERAVDFGGECDGPLGPFSLRCEQEALWS